jgi:hypothetical protein
MVRGKVVYDVVRNCGGFILGGGSVDNIVIRLFCIVIQVTGVSRIVELREHGGSSHISYFHVEKTKLSSHRMRLFIKN